MKIYFSDHAPLNLPEGHSFPATKYSLLFQRIAAAGLPDVELIASTPASDEQLKLAHTRDYVARVINGEIAEKEMRRIGFPWSPTLVARSKLSVGGTIAACRAAIEEGMAANLAGGTHHAYSDHGEGYCVFNDVAIASRQLQLDGIVGRVVIIDCDVHQGNGTAAIFAQDPSVFTFSIHGQKNFPFHKEPSDLDVGLPDGCNDECFLTEFHPALASAIERSQADLAIYIAGADPYIDDRLGRMKLSKGGLLERDCMVYHLCYQHNLPVATVLGGGYARQVSDTVDIHFQTLRLAAHISAGLIKSEDSSARLINQIDHTD